MADYNVNMKQWNGTSFDNVLPLAYDAKQLGGKTYQEIKAYIDGAYGEKAAVVAGSYVGNGKYGQNNPNNIVTGFKPVGLCIENQWTILTYTGVGLLGYDNKVTWSNSGVSWYNEEDNTLSAREQYNENGIRYSYVVIGYNQ